jgi:alkyl sulfatase BDS1-like metallo-beta-lactamase superfamily hydrolase
VLSAGAELIETGRLQEHHSSRSDGPTGLALGVTLVRLLLDAAAVIPNLQAEGNAAVIAELFGMLDRFEPDFPIVTP